MTNLAPYPIYITDHVLNKLRDLITIYIPLSTCTRLAHII